MAYKTGMAGSLHDFVNALRLLGESVGWVTQRESHGRWYFRNQASTQMYAMEVSDGTSDQHGAVNGMSPFPNGRAVLCSGHTSLDPNKRMRGHPGSSVPNNQPITYMSLKETSATFNPYYMFATTEYIHAVWENPEKHFYHIQVGMLDKKGMVYDGGQYIQATGVYWENATYKESFVWASLQGDNSNRVRLTGFDAFNDSNGWYGDLTALGNGRYSRHADAPMAAASANAFTGDTVLVPCRVLRSGSNRREWYLGEVRDFAIVSMMYCVPGQILTYGAEEWQVFPAYKIGQIGTSNPSRTFSGDVGYAYRVRR